MGEVETEGGDVEREVGEVGRGCDGEVGESLIRTA